MADITIHKVEISDLLTVAKKMRPADVDEVRAATGATPLNGLTMSWTNSPRAATARIEDEPIAVYGIGRWQNEDENVGCPWLLGTEGVIEHAAAFTRHTRPEFARMTQGYNRLVNFVDARNTTSVRWLKWLGFSFDEPAPYGVESRPFHRVYMEV